MSTTVRGFLAKLNTKSGTGKRGPWTLYSGRLELESGQEYENWISFGFENPGVKEGEFLEVEVEQDKNGYYQAKSVTVPKNPPARAGAKRVSKDASSSVAESGTAGDTGANRQTQIVMQHSQEIAIRVVEVLLANKALPISGNAAKAGEAKRFDEIMAAIDKLTVQYYNDVVTARLLDVVADAGADRVDTTPDGAIPGASDTDEESFDA